MRRVLVIPAAGRGSRLNASVAKALVRVNGRPMLDHLFSMYRDHVSAFVVVTSLEARTDIARLASAAGRPVRLAVQERPTGMLDAILAAGDDVRAESATRVWITWCDQIAIRPETILRLAAEEASPAPPSLVLPTVRRRDPYIHFERDEQGRVAAVRQRREGDDMPDEGESDAGLFALSREAFDALGEMAATVEGRGTGERNFLPLIPALARRGAAITFECADPMEAVGVNTADELRGVEAYLRDRTAG